MEAVLMEAVPFNADKAQEFADLFGKARGSVIAKIKSMEAKILKDNHHQSLNNNLKLFKSFREYLRKNSSKLTKL